MTNFEKIAKERFEWKWFVACKKQIQIRAQELKGICMNIIFYLILTNNYFEEKQRLVDEFTWEAMNSDINRSASNAISDTPQFYTCIYHRNLRMIQSQIVLHRLMPKKDIKSLIDSHIEATTVPPQRMKN